MDQLIDITCVPIKLEFEVHPTKIEYDEKVSDVNIDVDKSSYPDLSRFKSNFDIVEISDGPHITPVCTAKKGVMNDIKNTLCKAITIDAKSNHKISSSSLKNDFNKTFNEIKIEFEEKPKREIVPGFIEYNVTQYPDVIIKFIGDMLYVPPSANPNYEKIL